MRTAPRTTALLLAALLVAVAACSSGDDDTSSDEGVGAGGSTTTQDAGGTDCPAEQVVAGDEGAEVVAAVEAVAQENGLTSALYRVTRGDEVVASGAVGESMARVPADPSMHFRIGNVAFGYMGTLLLSYVDDGTATLDDPISRWFPDADLPSADEVTLRMLVQNTSGYPDYVPDPDFVDAFLADPFADFTPDQLVDIGLSTPVHYEPGTGWSYAHTNYVILGEALEAIGGDTLGNLLADRVLEPAGLTDTAPALTPAVPEPVLQTYSTERDVFESTTFWNPSWQTAPGAILTSTICDVATGIAAVGSGALTSEESLTELLTPAPASLDPVPEGCDVCRQWSETTFYGLGVLSTDGWVFQSPLFGGAGGVAAYLPDEDVSVALVAVDGQDTPINTNLAIPMWAAVAEVVAPDAVPSLPR